MSSEAEIEAVVAQVVARLSERGASKKPEGRPECGSCPVRKHCDPVRVLGSVSQGAKRIGVSGPVDAPPCAHLAELIDHTLLKPEATREELKKVCAEARQYGFKTVCVNSGNVRYAATLLSGSNVVPIAVVGFPLGVETPEAKAFETREAVRNGAKEIDMVINVGALKSRDHARVFEDMRAVVDAAKQVPVKVILETSKLNTAEKNMACALAKAAGAAFVKTSTGFGGGGATPEDIALMRAAVGPEMGVKASGGVRTSEDAQRVIEAGATRIGASASVAIVKGETPARKKSRGLLSVPRGRPHKEKACGRCARCCRSTLAHRGLYRRGGERRPALCVCDGGVLQGHGPRRDGGLGGSDARLGSRDGLFASLRKEGRQAFDRRRGGQSIHLPRTVGRGLRGSRAHDFRARSGTYRRNAGQVGGNSWFQHRR